MTSTFQAVTDVDAVQQLKTSLLNYTLKAAARRLNPYFVPFLSITLSASLRDL